MHDGFGMSHEDVPDAGYASIMSKSEKPHLECACLHALLPQLRGVGSQPHLKDAGRWRTYCRSSTCTAPACMHSCDPAAKPSGLLWREARGSAAEAGLATGMGHKAPGAARLTCRWLHLVTDPACCGQRWQEARLKLPCHRPRKRFKKLCVQMQAPEARLRMVFVKAASAPEAGLPVGARQSAGRARLAAAALCGFCHAPPRPRVHVGC